MYSVLGGIPAIYLPVLLGAFYPMMETWAWVTGYTLQHRAFSFFSVLHFGRPFAGLLYPTTFYLNIYLLHCLLCFCTMTHSVCITCFGEQEAVHSVLEAMPHCSRALYMLYRCLHTLPVCLPGHFPLTAFILLS
jgi:hypothetical protein